MDRIYVQRIKDLTDSGFNPVEASDEIITTLDTLCQSMLDPENRPPQWTVDQAWEKYLTLQNKLGSGSPGDIFAGQ